MHKQYPIDSTVFDLDVAKHLADMSFRTKKPGPWVGKEEQLLDALWWAELGHAKWCATTGVRPQFQALVRKLKRDKRKKQLKDHIEVVWNGWRNLTREEQLQFAAATQNMGEIRPAIVLHEEIERVLRNLAGTSNLLSNLSLPSGEIPKLGGLERFVDRLRTRWKAQNFEEKFSHEFEPQISNDNLLFPISTASKLVCEASKLLPGEYSIENCDCAMRPRR